MHRVGDSLVIEGLPDGCTPHPINSTLGARVGRAAHYATELMKIRSWLTLAGSSEVAISEALAMAAIVRFCACFERGGGHRERPLKQKILTPEGRVTFRKLLLIRNKMVAHDEGLFPMDKTLLVLDADAIPHSKLGVSAWFNLFDLPEVKEMHELVGMALTWVDAENESASNELLEQARAAAPEDLAKLKAEAPKITFKSGTLEKAADDAALRRGATSAMKQSLGTVGS